MCKSSRTSAQSKTTSAIRQRPLASSRARTPSSRPMGRRRTISALKGCRVSLCAKLAGHRAGARSAGCTLHTMAGQFAVGRAEYRTDQVPELARHGAALGLGGALPPVPSARNWNGWRRRRAFKGWPASMPGAWEPASRATSTSIRILSSTPARRMCSKDGVRLFGERTRPGVIEASGAPLEPPSGPL